jgi:hypothetical protein
MSAGEELTRRGYGLSETPAYSKDKGEVKNQDYVVNGR